MHDLTRWSVPRPRLAIALRIAAAAAAFAFGPCGTGARGTPTPAVRPLAAGETLGQVDRADAGTPTSGVRTLLSVTCQAGKLFVRTNVDSISAPDDCTQPIPQSTLDAFLGLPVVITYTGDQLIIENVARGAKFALNARNATVGEIHGSP